MFIAIFWSASVTWVFFLLFLIVYYSGIPIFRTSKGKENWFEKSGVRKIESGIESHLFYRGIVLKDSKSKTTTLLLTL